jgi:hypothetical protein
MKNPFYGASAEFKNSKTIFADIDVESHFNRHLRTKFDVSFLPTIILFKNSNMDDRNKFQYIVGNENKYDLVKWIKDNTN